MIWCCWLLVICSVLYFVVCTSSSQRKLKKVLSFTLILLHVSLIHTFSEPVLFLMAFLVCFPAAISFLIETGTLLHFPDTSHGLCTLYFLCPVWLSDCLERIICLRSSQPMARNGVIQAKDLKVLEGTGFTQQTQEQYFQFLAKFEIALPLGNNSYLLPHLLPPKPAMDIHNIHRSTTNTLQRVFKMSFVPAGFWERFIARMLISLAEMDLQDPMFTLKRITSSLAF
ncbi:leucine-rich repeat serine/threonine-protein kinase 1-like [Nothobranchius furzeri]|uniref:Leucine-rich repeat serine/threonine-protein kinase 1-like n=1 Tax=Nothobranchius furzeri TaxID=105023 RepID=A0A9D2XBI1_NOTFU|nr:leucine-rich repeat serine/threonine-protein kinase 1-like [Nothobranchius furzeri]